MMYVSGKNLIVFILTVFVLTGCKEPEMQLSTLGKKLPAPSLKGESPFDQDFDTQNYARVQGSCDSRVGTILVSFDKSVWHQPPSSPDLTDTALAAGLANDSDCSDGSFDIYLTKNDLQNIWGITTGSSGTDIDYIYIKGSSIIGDTETLTLVDGDANNPGSGSNGAAAYVVLEKSWPRGFAGSNQCGSFSAFLNTANGQRAVHTADVSFQLSKTAAGSTYRGITAYKTWNDCQSDANTTDTFTIPAAAGYTEIYYRFPASPIDGILSFKIINTSALSASTTSADVTLRNSEASSIYRWLSLDEHSSQIYKNICYPFRLRSHNYNNSSAYDQFGGTLDVAASDARMKFYTDASCGTVASSYTFTSYDPVIVGYIKFSEATASDTPALVDLTVTGATGNYYSYDTLPLNFRVDLSSKSIAAKLDLWGPRDIGNGYCNAYNVVTMNANGTMLPVNGDLTVNLATKESNLGYFFEDESCATPITTAVVAKNTALKKVYFRASVANAGSYHFNVNAAGLTNHTPIVNISTPITQFKIAPIDMIAGACKAVSIGVADGAGIFRIADQTYNAPISVSITPTPGSNVIFADPSCSVPASPSYITVGSGMGAAVLYIQTAGLNGKLLNLTVSAVAGVSGTAFSGTFQ
ncbi:hypothetical protein ACES2I_02570 [Bdellovibrio bacteriovorus]|uniref:hypothetical protein n=1 Tax=Bdellovibrio bacteriovorus TaxID=959 RepID=UPI0035A58787